MRAPTHWAIRTCAHDSPFPVDLPPSCGDSGSPCISIRPCAPHSTLVNGSAGAGKTLLTADSAAELRLPVAWLTVEAGDHQPGVFWAYVFESLRACGTSAAGTAGASADSSGVGWRLLGSLAAELNALDRPVVLVLDEYDRIIAPEVAEQLEFVLHHSGQGLRLVLVTRTEPLLPLHRYRAADELTEIRGAELSFTPEEAGALLRLHGLRLPESAASALADRTRGWAAGPPAVRPWRPGRAPTPSGI
ncbi:HTH-type transcriptional regulator MalT [Streptomyces tendae]